ncbi:hypothetical protein MANES_15G117100v8 [Manihot esculenta]|uniref:Uncharacterized protein n=1 Tax=Manihot esculenta TaxID=3983 RepID=A0ACB7GAT7_MANES|nr:hypothetical protein MANES_15G117100v8 [Manihot esculenta]
MKQSPNTFSPAPANNPPVNLCKEVGSRALGILSGSDSYNSPSDATLFSSSLPVLPHEKLNLNDTECSHQSIDDASSSLDNLRKDEDVEGSDLLEDVETHAIGSLLPDDEDELLAGIMEDFDLSRLPGSLEDLEDYDLFSSGGGMELENDPQESLSMCISKQYGDIRTLYTACKHRGFVMISYYDIRAARTAMRALQNKPLRRRKLDIHFSIPKDNPSDKDINQGTLVVFNLDPSVSNEDLRQIFGAYGEVKEIRETPHKRHHKFIEFYDVRAAEAALKSLNRSDIAGKRIKLEPSRPGGARRNLMLQLNQELEQDESRSFWPPVGSPITNSPPGNWAQFNSPREHSPLQSTSKSPVFRNLSPTGNHLPGLASVLHSQVSNSVKVAPIGKDQGRGSLREHTFANMNSAQGAAFQLSHSLPESKLNQYHGSMSSFGGPSTSNGSVVETLSGPQFLWGSPNAYTDRATSSAWTTPSMGNPFSSNANGHGLSYMGRHGSLLASSQNHHHVGSAPSGVPLKRHFGFFPESPDTSIMSSVAFGGMGLGHNDGSFMMNMGAHGPMNTGVTIPRNISENGSSYRMMSSPRLNPVFLGNGPYPGLATTSMEGFPERGRSRRVENNGNQVDSKKQFQLDLDKIISGEDTRTTLMIKNIPNKYTSKMLLAAIDESHRGTYDFLYLPIDFKAFNGKKWEKFNSEKVASLAYARIQGKAALVTHFQNSSLMNEDKRCRPILFHSEGQEAGDQIVLEHLPSSSLNIEFRQPDGSQSGDSPGSPTMDGSGEKSDKS